MSTVQGLVSEEKLRESQDGEMYESKEGMTEYLEGMKWLHT